MEKNTKKIKYDSKKSLIWVSIVFGTLFLLLLAAILYTQYKNNKKNVVEDIHGDDEITKNQNINEEGKDTSTNIPNNPLQAV